MAKDEKSCPTTQCMKALSKKVKRMVKVGTFGLMAHPMKVNGTIMRCVAMVYSLHLIKGNTLVCTKTASLMAKGFTSGQMVGLIKVTI